MTGPARSVTWETPTRTAKEANLSRPAVYGLLAFAIVVLGLNWPIMVTGLKSVTPIWLGFFRVSGAAVFVLLMTGFTGNLVKPQRQDIPMIITISIFRLSAVMVLVFFALKLVPAGRASVLVWTSSLWTVPIAALFLGERITGRKWIGLVLGIVGVFVISQIWTNDWGDTDVLAGMGLLLLAALVSAGSSVYIRGHQWTIDPMQALPWQLMLGAVLLGSLGLIVDGVPDIDWTPTLGWVIAYQAIPASGLAFWSQIVVLRNNPAVSTNLSMMGVPVLGVLSSAIFLDERITLGLTIGIALVFVGVSINLLSE